MINNITRITQQQRKDIIEEIATYTNKLIVVTLIVIILNFIVFIGLLSSD